MKKKDMKLKLDCHDLIHKDLQEQINRLDQKVVGLCKLYYEDNRYIESIKSIIGELEPKT